MIKVGSYDEKTDKKIKYTDVEFDDNWIDVKKYLPMDFDLVTLRIENHDNPLKGWFTGQSWDGMKFKSGMNVIGWRREKSDEQ